MLEKIASGVLVRSIQNAIANEGWPEEAAQNVERGIRLEWQKKEEFGDLSTPCAMVLAKIVGKPPRVIAEKIVNQINRDQELKKILSRVDLAGPGYINLFFANDFLCEFLSKTLSSDQLTDKVPHPRKINLEFVSANPTGPLHVGHGRGAAFGDTLARILREVGHQVSTEYYINDAGNQMNMLGKSVYLAFRRIGNKWTQEEKDRLLGEGEGYKGDYIREIAQKIWDDPSLLPASVRENALAGRFTDDVQSVFTDFSQTFIMAEIREDLTRFGVFFDRFFSEKILHEERTGGKSQIKTWIERLEHETGGAVYSDDGAVWFRSTLMGDDKDRVLRKSDGSYTYFAADIAYHADKIARGYEILVDVWGADHHGYQTRMQAAVKTLGDHAKRDVLLEICLIQLVSLTRAGKSVSMSTRAGEFVTLGEVLDEVGVDATRFSYLTRSHESPLEFDLAKAKEKTMDNPVFYVQYAHARVRSLLAQAALRNVHPGRYEPEDLAPLTEPEERSMIRLLAQFSGVVERCADSFEVHPMTDYLTLLAASYHHYYFHHRILSSEEKDRPVMMARLGLSIAVARIIRKGLSLLGVSAPDSM